MMWKYVSKRFNCFLLEMANLVNRDLRKDLGKAAGTPAGPGNDVHTAEGSGVDPPLEGVSMTPLIATQLEAQVQKAVDSALATKTPNTGTLTPNNYENPEAKKEHEDQNDLNLEKTTLPLNRQVVRAIREKMAKPRE